MIGFDANAYATQATIYQQFVNVPTGPGKLGKTDSFMVNMYAECNKECSILKLPPIAVADFPKSWTEAAELIDHLGRLRDIMDEEFYAFDYELTSYI